MSHSQTQRLFHKTDGFTSQLAP